MEQQTTLASNIECKKICAERFIYAIAYSVGSQYFLLAIFLLFVNFNILHPISWISNTFALLFSFYTWLWTMPLICAVIIHGIFLAKSHLGENKYYPSRFSLLYRTLFPKTVLLVINCIVGFLTVWLYSKFLRDDYNVLYTKCDMKKCFNEKYLFLTINGFFAGFYFFMKNKLKNHTLVFQVIQQTRYLQIRSQVYSIIYTSFIKSFFPTLIYIFSYYTIGGMLRFKIVSYYHGVELLEPSNLKSFYNILSDMRLILYVWILSSQILSNMKLMQVMYTIFLTEYKEFPIEKSSFQVNGSVTLAEALSNDKIPITQQLAAFDLFLLSDSCYPARRSQFYALSVPGGHPYNWRLISDECLKLITEYTAELSKSIDYVADTKARSNITNLKPTASDFAERVVMKQYNESYGIRNMSSPPMSPISSGNEFGTIGSNEKSLEITEILSKKLQKVKSTIINLPGIFYLFGKPTNGKTCYMLAKNSQIIIWVTQSVSSLAAHSIHEDDFGVVQNDLPAIIKALLQLKLVLDKIGSINLGVKKVDRNYIALKSAVKRSLYKITTTFSEYLNDIVTDLNDMKMLQPFIKFRES